MSRRLLFALLLAAVCPYFIDLGGSSIWDANEAFYVETPREMIESGDYISPTFNYEPRLNKPVLSYWIVAVFYHLFGVSVGVQRVPIAVGAVVIIAVAFFLARAASPAGAARPWHAAGLWAALGLAVTPRLVMFARRIFIDIYISVFMALVLVFFALSERYPHRRRVFLVLMYVSVGLGVLTKGPVAAVLPALIFGFYLAWYRELRRVRDMMIPAGLIIVLAIVAPWYAVLYARHGWTPIWSFFVGENVGRYTAVVGFQSRGPLFYVPIVFTDSFPWSVLLIPAAVYWWTRRATTSAPQGAARVRTLLWLWIVGIVAFYSLSQTKQDLYIFPIAPAIAALGGAFVQGAATESPRGRLFRITSAVLGALLLATGLGALYLVTRVARMYLIDGVTLIGVLTLAGGAATIALAMAARTMQSLVAVAVTMIALNWVFVVRVLPSIEPYKPSLHFAGILEKRAGPEDVIIHYKLALPSMVYYLRRHIDVFYDDEPFYRALASSRTLYIVISSRDYESVAVAPGVATCVVDRRPIFEAKLKDLLAREPLPELLLVTTACDGSGASRGASAELDGVVHVQERRRSDTRS